MSRARQLVQSPLMGSYGVPAGLLLVLLLIWISHFNPLLGLVPSRDSGVFLYVGQQLNRGLVVYRDLVDIKGPFLYFLNAWSLRLFGETAWAPYVGEWLLVTAGSMLGYFGLRKRLGTIAAAAAMVVWLLLVNRHVIGNLAEEWAWFIQWAAVCVFCFRPARSSTRWHWVVIGALGAAAFLIKMTCTVLWVAIVLVEAIEAIRSRHAREFLCKTGLMVVGAAGVALGLGLYFLLTGSLSAFLGTYFGLAFAYVGHPSLADRVGVVLDGAQRVSWPAILATAAVWAVVTLSWLRRRVEIQDPLIALVVVWLPLEVVVSSLAGRGGRYTWTWLPAIALLLAVAVSLAKDRRQRVALVLVLCLAALGPLPQFVIALRNIGGSVVHSRAYLAEQAHTSTRETVAALKSMTDSGDTVLVWGDYSDEINFLAARESPTRYVFQPFLYVRAYEEFELVPAFLADLQRRPPSVILDSSPDADALTPRPSLSSVGRSWPGGTDHFEREWEAVGRWIRDNYRMVGKLPGSGWLIYAKQP